MANLKQKTIHGFVWSFIDNISKYGITFIFGIILARLLSPRDYGLIGITGIFITVSQVFIYSGLGSALIRKKVCTPVDYSTVFYFNLFISVLCFILLFLFSGTISVFFHESLLKQILRVLSIGLVINSFSIIQVTVLTKRVDFKLQTKITIASSVGSGLIGIVMAYSGFGVWSLVAKTLAGYSISLILFWLFNKWRPVWQFSWQSLKEMFAFSSKLLASAILNIIYQNIYLLIIGKYFSAVELGYYTRADHFKNLPSQNIEGVISRVTYPVLSQIQDDDVKLKSNYKKLIKSTTLITFVLMACMAAVAEPMIITLIGEKWRPSIIYLQMLCFVGMMYPLHSLNLNILNVKGRSDIFLKLSIIKKILVIPTVFIGITFGIKYMLLGMMVNTIIAYYINSYYSGKFINYRMLEQVMDILPSLIISIVSAAIVFLIGKVLPFAYSVILVIQIISGVFIFLLICEITKVEAYKAIKEIVVKRIPFFKNKKE